MNITFQTAEEDERQKEFIFIEKRKKERWILESSILKILKRRLKRNSLWKNIDFPLSNANKTCDENTNKTNEKLSKAIQINKQL